MVLRRLKSGSIGYDAQNIPRARRSVRKRVFCQKPIDDDQLCAFELLAAVAGKLLQESETSSASSSAAEALITHNISKDFIKQEPQLLIDDGTRMEHEPGRSEESGVSSAQGLQKCTQKDYFKESGDVSSEALLKQISNVSNSSSFANVRSDVKPVVHNSKDKFGKLASKEDGISPKCGESFDPNEYNGIARCHDVTGAMSEVLEVVEKLSSKNCVESCGNLSSPDHFSEKAGLAPCRGSTVDSVYVKHKNDMNIDGRDDDEIFSQLSGPSSQEKAYRSPTNVEVEDCRISKILTSKYWKSAPKLKDYKPINSGGKRSNIYPNGKSCHDHERFQNNTPFKKRKLFDQSSVITHDGGISSESASNSNEKGFHSSNSSPAKSSAGNKMTSSSMDRQISFNSRNSPVKLSINSFIVPELLVEVPESSTVASLKKTVMDAVKTVLGGGLRVGMLLNGRKIRDDSRTLLQTGISENGSLDDLAFILEPSSTKQLSPKRPYEDPPVIPTCLSPKDNVNRCLIPKQEFPALDIAEKTSVTDSGRICQDLVPFSAKLEANPVSDCKALVAVTENVEALDIVPMNSKPRRSEIGQRRIRRPFSVTEVEALVQAVEKLGTGRWRDVKLAAFENAKHRTYVDLKDKWKTLVHTAKIGPQQRRGEPVPQELLDRVLAAHSHWCQHQAKQKQVHSDQPFMLKLSDPLAQKVSA